MKAGASRDLTKDLFAVDGIIEYQRTNLWKARTHELGLHVDASGVHDHVQLSGLCDQVIVQCMAALPFLSGACNPYACKKSSMLSNCYTTQAAVTVYVRQVLKHLHILMIALSPEFLFPACEEPFHLSVYRGAHASDV